MEDEEIIKNEAKEFYHREIIMGKSDLPSDQISVIKNRLYNFYAPEDKAIFLDEIESSVRRDLQKHRDLKHNGLPSLHCSEDQDRETLLFYIRQEMGILPAIVHQKNDSNPKQERNKVFVSYCHADNSYLNDIKRHFKPFLKHVDFWDDSKIEPGKKWKDEITVAISQTKVAILLVSTDFLGSEFITTEEVPPLLKAAEENGATILTVILKPCLFEDFPELNIYQAMNPPSRPVSRMDENEKEELYMNVVRQTKKLLEN